jgi:hypothetical protein
MLGALIKHQMPKKRLINDLKPEVLFWDTLVPGS